MMMMIIIIYLFIYYCFNSIFLPHFIVIEISKIWLKIFGLLSHFCFQNHGVYASVCVYVRVYTAPVPAGPEGYPYPLFPTGQQNKE